MSGDRLDHLADDRSDMDRQPLAIQVVQHPREPGHRAVAVDHGAVAARAADGRFQPADLLLAELDRIEALPCDDLGDTSGLAERVADALEELGVFLDEELRTEIASVLLVAEHDENHVAGKLQLSLSRAYEGRDEHRDRAFHVDGAATPDLPVDEISSEWRSLPLLAGSRDHVDVALQQERWADAGTLQAGAQVRPGRGLRVVGGLAARVFH